MMHDKPQAVYLESTEVRRRSELIPATCSCRHARLYAVTSLASQGVAMLQPGDETGEVIVSQTMLLCVARLDSPHSVVHVH